MSWLSLAQTCGKKAYLTKPPEQWVWITIAASASFFAGLFINKQLEDAARKKLDIELQKRRAAELVHTAAAAHTEYAAEEIRKAAVRALADIAAAEEMLANTRAELDIKKQKLDAARTWEELEDVK